MTLPLIQEFRDWLDGLRDAQIPLEVSAFCLNLSEAMDAFNVDLIGAIKYDADDDDWACDEAFRLSNECFNLPHSVVGESWEEAQQLVGGWLRNFMKSKSSPLCSAKAVAVGFVDGDLELVWLNGRPTDQRPG